MLYPVTLPLSLDESQKQQDHLNIAIPELGKLGDRFFTKLMKKNVNVVRGLTKVNQFILSLSFPNGLPALADVPLNLIHLDTELHAAMHSPLSPSTDEMLSTAALEVPP